MPEELGGIVTERSAMTGVLVAEAMAHGDMGQAVACLAPAAVSTAISLWGDETQQATYLPAFTGSSVPAAALAIAGTSAAVRSVHAEDAGPTGSLAERREVVGAARRLRPNCS